MTCDLNPQGASQQDSQQWSHQSEETDCLGPRAVFTRVHAVYGPDVASPYLGFRAHDVVLLLSRSFCARCR